MVVGTLGETMKKIAQLLMARWKELVVALFMAFVGYELIEIRSELSFIESDVSSIASDVSSIESDVSSIESRINY